MHRVVSFVVACAGVAAVAMAAAPSEQAVQGLYEGAYKDAAGLHKFEARVVACGDGTYKIFLREDLADGKVAKVELDGKTEGEAVTFAGKAGDTPWACSYADGAIKGTCGKDPVEMKRVVRASPTYDATPPAGAIVLLDGKSFDEMVIKPLKGGALQQWKLVEDSGIEVPKGGMTSKRQFEGSFKLHVEFKNPLMSKARSQGRGNSGCYLPNGEEIQVLDSFGMTTYTGGGCGGIYKYKDPDAFDTFSLASLPPGQWQTYDIEYRVETKDGKPAGNPRVTVFHNGIKIHDNFETKKAARKGTINFQDHGNPVQYRNIWVLPLEDKK